MKIQSVVFSFFVGKRWTILQFSLLFLLTLFSCAAADPLKQQTAHSGLGRWKNAVIQLEGAADSVSSHERSERWFELSHKLREGKISQDEFIKESQKIDKGLRDVRYLVV